MTHDFARPAEGFSQGFHISDAAVEMAPGLGDFAQRSAAMAEVLERLRTDGSIKGWRDEPYPVGDRFLRPALLQMERAAVPLFGVRAYGVHINGFTGEGTALQALGRQALEDQADGAGQARSSGCGRPAPRPRPDGQCGEGMRRGSGHGPALARTARPAGFVSYVTERVEGLRNDICFVYDIALPADFGR